MLIIIILFPLLLHAMDPNHAVDTYFGTKVTPHSIGRIVPKPPMSLALKMHDWQAENSGLVKLLLSNPKTNENTKNTHDANKKFLHLLNIQLLSRDNYVFSLPIDNNYIVKIVGPGRRYETLRLYQRDVDISKKSVTTYNTVSHAAFYVRFLELASMIPLRHILVPETYLFAHFDSYDDTSAIVVQEKLDLSESVSVKRLRRDDQLDQVPHQAWHDIMQVFKYAPLPDIEANLLYDKKTKKFVIVDFEDFYQYYENFCNTKRSFYVQKVEHDFEYLLLLAVGYHKIQACIQNFICSNAELRKIMKTQLLRSGADSV